MNGSLERHETERYLDPWDTFGFVPDESRIEVKWFIGASAETEVWWKATVKRCSATELVGPVVELVYDALPEHGFESQEVCRARFVSKCVLEHVEDGIQGEMVWRCEGDDDDGDEHAPALDVIRHTLSREIENHPSHVQRVLADKVTMAIDAFRDEILREVSNDSNEIDDIGAQNILQRVRHRLDSDS
ncbi:hypothetical protein M9435_006592 [Picochlorum sp. BPE23]|nr:hypothetical protein M9435_006592 [Picochlorum sp. BPE23]WPT18037.1 hypothetical protein PSENEW3_00006039 [Picochlorum sp. SENEW3]